MISVIVPVYNTADYLEDCILSIVNQSEKDLQILLIDDCSTDASSSILDQWQKRDSRIEVIHKEKNSGVSESRNLGLQMAKGEFISFIDSDDWIEPDMYAQLLRVITDADADIAFAGYKRITPSGAASVYSEYASGTVVSQEEALKHCIPQRNAGKYDLYIWDKLFRKQALMLNGSMHLFDPTYYYSEDILWLIQVLLHSKRIVFWQGIGYNYRCERPGNTWTAIASYRNLAYCENALTANINFWQILKNAGSASQNNAYQRVLFYQRYALRTAALQKDKQAYQKYARHYISGLLHWFWNNKTLIGFHWTLRQLASHLVFRIRHPLI